MSIGDDIKSVLSDLGVSFKVLRDGGAVDGGKLDYELPTTTGNTFVREHVLPVTLPYDTIVTHGDLIQFDTDGRIFLVAHKTPEVFENAVITNEGVLYLCNSTASFLRPSGEVDSNYRTRTNWESIKTNVPTLVTNQHAVASMDASRDFIQMDLAEVVAFVPKSWNILPHDRLVVSGEIVHYDEDHVGDRRYAVKYKQSFDFVGIEMVYLEEDTRE